MDTLSLTRPAAATGSAAPRRRRLVGVVSAMALPMALALPATGASTGTAAAAGVDPLPAVARALAHVTSSEVAITSSGSGFRGSGSRSTRPPSGNRRRGTGFFGRGSGTRTLVAVRKGSQFEDYVVFSGTNSSGKTVVNEIVIYGSKMCRRTNKSGPFTCQSASGRFNFNLDPTTAFEQSAGPAVFTPVSAKTIAGQVCNGYSYVNKSQFGQASGVVYISRTTNLPCEQLATNTGRSPNGGGTFTQKSTYVWSRFNDRGLTVPAIPTS